MTKRLAELDRAVPENANRVTTGLNAKTIRILHVDDDSNILAIIKQTLELEEGFEVDTVSSVSEALKRINVSSYDVIVSDYQIQDQYPEERSKSERKPPTCAE
ncbi:MAG: response regulator [Candidatus Bathyarchaeia archaeon]